MYFCDVINIFEKSYGKAALYEGYNVRKNAINSARSSAGRRSPNSWPLIARVSVPVRIEHLLQTRHRPIVQVMPAIPDAFE